MRESNSVTFKNATIDTDDMTITEYTKDESYSFNLFDVLKRWDGIDGISLSIKKDSDKTE